MSVYVQSVNVKFEFPAVDVLGGESPAAFEAASFRGRVRHVQDSLGRRNEVYVCVCVCVVGVLWFARDWLA